MQCRDTKRPHFKDACRSQHLNVSHSKRARDSLVPVNFAIRLRGKFSPALVTSMGCSHRPCDRGDMGRKGQAGVPPGETLQSLSWFWPSCASSPAAAVRTTKRKPLSFGSQLFLLAGSHFSLEELPEHTAATLA